MTKLQLLKNSYLSLLNLITDTQRENTYNNPRTTDDKRMREVWARLENSKIELRLLTSYDCSDLAPDSDSMIEFFQPREDTTLGGEEDYYKEFYELNKRREEIPFATRLDGVLYMILGWKRARAHEHAVKVKGKDSKLDIIELIFPEDMPPNAILLECNKLARMGNKKINSVREESRGDYSLQVSTAYKLECMNNIKAKNWNTEQKLKWASQWVIDEVSEDYAVDSMKTALGNIVNQAFAEHRGQSLPMPTAEEINLNAKRFFPNIVKWTEETAQGVIKRQCSSRLDKITEKLRNVWMKELPPSKARTPAYLTLRVGKTLDFAITSTKTVDEQIKTTLKDLKDHYTSAPVVFAGMPMPTKILFVKQMDQGTYRAFQWEEDLGEYVEVEEVVTK